MHNSMCGVDTQMLALRVIEIATSRVFVGVPQKNPMSASAERNSKKHIYGAQDEGMGPLTSV